MNKIIKIILIVLMLASAASAKSALDIGIAGVGARPMGMGKSFVAVADDVNAVFLNPAGMAFQDSWGITSMSTRLLNRVDYNMLGGIYPTHLGTFGIGYLTLNTPAGYLTTDRDSLASATQISYGSSMLVISYAHDLNKRVQGNPPGHLAVGGNLKLINNNFDGISNAHASGIETDLGVMFKPKDGWTLGANFQNCLSVSDNGKVSWASGMKEGVPAVFKLGAAYQARPDLLVSLDSDISINGDQSALLHAGVEWNPHPIVVLRAGLDQDLACGQTVNNLTVGTSVNFNGFSFDYAYRQDGTQADLSNHYFSISFTPQEKSVLVSEAKEKEQNEKNQKSIRRSQELSYEELMAEHYGSQDNEKSTKEMSDHQDLTTLNASQN